jgi:hypothetical protein
MTANYYPDGLAPEAINALQQTVDDELRREGHPEPHRLQPQEPPTRRSARQASRQLRPLSGLAGRLHSSRPDTTDTSREAAA